MAGVGAKGSSEAERAMVGSPPPPAHCRDRPQRPICRPKRSLYLAVTLQAVASGNPDAVRSPSRPAADEGSIRAQTLAVSTAANLSGRRQSSKHVKLSKGARQCSPVRPEPRRVDTEALEAILEDTY